MEGTTDQSEKLETLNEAIESGITSTSSDSHSASQDLRHLERIRRETRLRDTSHVAAGRVRPTIVGINLRGAW
jgi:hypothetical protein